jgi:hypothetical protein
MDSPAWSAELAAARLRRLQWPLGYVGAGTAILLMDVEGARWAYNLLVGIVVLPVWTFPSIETGVRWLRGRRGGR